MIEDMKEISLSSEEVEDLYMNDGNEYLILEDSGDWVSEGKYEYCWFVYKHIKTGRFYELHLNRTGSYYSDYYINYSEQVLCEVEKIEITKCEWRTK
jgi:hypothetical protein